MAQFSWFFLMCAAVLGISYAMQETKTYYPNRFGYQSGYITQYNEPRVTIARVNNMTPGMHLDASEFLKNTYSSTATGDRCIIFRQRFADKYSQYTWHFVLYRAYCIQYIKSIEFSVGNDHYVLFATKK